MDHPDIIELQIDIAAMPEHVWAALTDAQQLVRWMGEPGMALQVDTNWQVGSSIVIRGTHTSAFTNAGKVLIVEPCVALAWNYLSSLSQLPDRPEHYTRVEFRLAPTASHHTVVTLMLSRFPTPAIFHHVNFYWRSALPSLKQALESAEIIPTLPASPSTRR